VSVVSIPDFFYLLAKWISARGRACKPGGYDMALWDGLWVKGDLLVSEWEGEFRCLEDGELVEAIRATAYPDCVSKASPAAVEPPYVELYGGEESAILLGVADGRVVLVEASGGQVGCVCITDIDVENFRKAAHILERRYMEMYKLLHNAPG